MYNTVFESGRHVAVNDGVLVDWVEVNRGEYCESPGLSLTRSQVLVSGVSIRSGVMRSLASSSLGDSCGEPQLIVTSGSRARHEDRRTHPAGKI